MKTYAEIQADHRASREHDLQLMNLLAHVEAAGFKAYQVKALRFEDKLLGPQHRHLIGSQGHINCVELHSGEIEPIPIIERPRCSVS